ELPVADPEAELPAPHEAPERISQTVRLAVLIAIIAPLLCVVTAPFMVWGWGFRWTEPGLLVSLNVPVQSLLSLFPPRPSRSRTSPGGVQRAGRYSRRMS